MEPKKHFGDPVHRRPLPFGEHYNKPQMQEDDLDSEATDQETQVTQNMPSYQSLEEKAIRSYMLIKVSGSVCWLICCLALLYFSYFISERGENFLAAIVPIAGFLMICFVAFIQKGRATESKNDALADQEKHDKPRERSNDDPQRFRRRKHFYRKR